MAEDQKEPEEVTPLEEILNETEAEDEGTKAREAEEADQAAETKEPEAEEETGEKDGESPPDPQMVPLAAKQDEVRKRQAAEENLRITQLELAEAKRVRQETPQAEPTPPDPVEDPEGFSRHLENRQNFALLNQKLNLSQAFAERQHGVKEVADGLQAFQTMVQTDPTLSGRMQNDPDPYGFIMEHVKSYGAVDAAGGMQAWMEAETARITAELEGKSAEEEKAKTASSIPETLADESNKGTRERPEFSEPDLSDLVTNIEDAPVQKQ